MAVARRLRPQYLIPIHDWHLTERRKRWLYGSAVRGLAQEGITVLLLDDFETVTLDV